MKRILIILALSAGVVCNAKAQVHFAPEAGLNLSKLNFDPAIPLTTSATNIGVKIGAVADISITKHFFIQPGIFYSMKGGKLKATIPVSVPGINVNVNVELEDKITLNYIDIPVMALYKFNAGPGKLFAGIGPNIGIGLNGKEKFTASALGIDSTAKADLEFGSDPDQFKRIDIGGNVNVGYELSMGLYLRLSYNMGFVNLSNFSGQAIKNRGFGLAIGYLIGKKD